MLLSPNDVKEEMFSKGDVLHFCSVDLVDCPTKEAHKKAIEIARNKGSYVSFDVNLRLNIWNDDKKCIKVVREFLEYADIVKVTDDELQLITGKDEIEDGINELFKIAKNSLLIFVTMGDKGSMVFDRNSSFKLAATKANVVDTTGAGDCFSGCIIYNILQREDKDKNHLSINDAKDYMRMASKGCAIVISKYGAMESMPTIEELR